MPPPRVPPPHHRRRRCRLAHRHAAANRRASVEGRAPGAAASHAPRGGRPLRTSAVPQPYLDPCRRVLLQSSLGVCPRVPSLRRRRKRLCRRCCRRCQRAGLPSSVAQWCCTRSYERSGHVGVYPLRASPNGSPWLRRRCRGLPLHEPGAQRRLPASSLFPSGRAFHRFRHRDRALGCSAPLRVWQASPAGMCNCACIAASLRFLQGACPGRWCRYRAPAVRSTCPRCPPAVQLRRGGDHRRPRRGRSARTARDLPL